MQKDPKLQWRLKAAWDVYLSKKEMIEQMEEGLLACGLEIGPEVWEHRAEMERLRTEFLQIQLTDSESSVAKLTEALTQVQWQMHFFEQDTRKAFVKLGIERWTNRCHPPGPLKS